jgi:hypothetical protein
MKNELIKKRPPHNLNLSFSFLCPPPLVWRLHSRNTLASFPTPYAMRKQPGPWELNEVKTRLRSEQVKREKAASERYRQQKDRGQDEGNRGITHQDVGSKGIRNCSDCILIVLVFCCFLLSLSVLALSSVILAQARK